MNNKFCANGKDHAHIVTKGSMRMAHNCDDRQERAKLHTDDEQDVIEAQREAEALRKAVDSKFKNLGWLLKK